MCDRLDWNSSPKDDRTYLQRYIYIYISAYINTIALYMCLYNCFCTAQLYNCFVCVYTYMSVCVYIYTYIYTHTHIYIHIYRHKLAMAQNPVTWPHLSKREGGRCSPGECHGGWGSRFGGEPANLCHSWKLGSCHPCLSFLLSLLFLLCWDDYMKYCILKWLVNFIIHWTERQN